MHAAAADGGGTVAVSSWVALSTLLVVGGLAALAAAAWMRHRMAMSQAVARSDAAALGLLLDGWQWRTDATHRLCFLQAPAADASGPAAGVPASTGGAGSPAGAIEACLTQRKDRGEASFTVQFEEAAPGAARTGAGAGGVVWALKAAPRTDEHGRFSGYVGTARRVDDLRHRAADQAALEVLIRSLPGALWLAERHPATGELTVRRCNEAGADMAGGERAGLPWSELLERLPAELQPVLRTLEPGGSTSHGAWSVHLERIGTVGSPTEGRLLALLPHAAEPAAAAVADQESFSYTVSHDLRAPIRVVEGFTRIVKEDYGRVLDRIGNDHLDRVLSAAARMNSMIDSLLALARLSSQPLARQPVNLTQLAGFVVDDLRRQHPDRTADVRVQPGMMAHGDPTLLRMMLENLLGNAWKYSSKVAHADIAFETTRHEGREVYLVRDNGAGFDMRFADRLFGVFQRLHSANDFHGTGVGLASVKRIVLRHGGDIWAESEVGKGARFYFTLRH